MNKEEPPIDPSTVRIKWRGGRPRLLSLGQMRHLARLAVSGKFRAKEIAARFGVSPRTVFKTLEDIRAGKIDLSWEGGKQDEAFETAVDSARVVD